MTDTRNTFQDGQPFSVAALNAMKHAHADEGVISGGELTLGTGDFDVDVSAVEVAIGGATYAADADTVALDAPGGDDRLDLIVATTDEEIVVEAGEPAAAAGQPNAPDIPEGAVLLGAVFVDGKSEELASANLFGEYRAEVGWKNVGFLQAGEPAVTEGGTWFDTDSLDLHVGWGGDWQNISSLPPIYGNGADGHLSRSTSGDENGLLMTESYTLESGITREISNGALVILAQSKLERKGET